MSNPRPSVLVLDLANTVRFLRSVATAQAMAETTRLEWKPYNESSVINIAYTILFWKEKPGWVEVQTGKRERVLARTDELTDAFWRRFSSSVHRGPKAMVALLRGLDAARTTSLSSVRQQFEDARAINGEVLELTRSGIQRLATIKLGADLVVKLSPMVAVSLPYSMATTFIKEFASAGSANVIAFKVALEPAKEGVKTAADKGSHLLGKEADGYRMALRNAQVDIARQNKLLRRASATPKSLSKATNRLEGATSAAAAARQGARVSSAASMGLKGLHFGFIALDVYESFHDWREAIGD